MVNYTPKRSLARESNPFSVCVSSIMQSNCLTLRPDVSISKAIDDILKSNLSGAPVVDADRRVIGFLSQKDCLKASANLCYLNSYPRNVKDYMSKSVHVFTCETRIGEALDCFNNHCFKAYPVVDQSNRLQGLLMRRRLLEYINSIHQNTWFESSQGLGGYQKVTSF